MMLERLSGTFLEPDGTKGTYWLKYYETPEGEIILGYTFSIRTMHKGVAVKPSQVLSFGDLKLFPKSKLRVVKPEEIYEEIGRINKHPLPEIGLLQKSLRDVPSEQEPPFESDEALDADLARTLNKVDQCWIDLAAQPFGSKSAMLEALWTTAPDISGIYGTTPTHREKSWAKIPYTKEAVALERGLYASKSMYDGWRRALENTAINQGVPANLAAKIASDFLETNFGIIIHLERSPEEWPDTDE